MTRPLTPEQVADRWQCSARHVRNLIARGQLPAFRLGGKLLRVDAESVMEFERCQNGDSADTAASSQPSGDTAQTGSVVRLERIAEQPSGSSTG